jgi:TM2 domain-containing membrane protein YozV/ribosomal protein L40E
MYCRNCASEVPDQAVMCVHCGVAPRTGGKYCHHCGAQTDPLASICVKCGVAVLPVAVQVSAFDPTLKSKLAAGLLGIFLGGLGIHRFYLGYTGIAVAQLILGLLGIFTCGITSIAAAIWGLVEGILILTGSINKDAQGKPLRE